MSEVRFQGGPPGAQTVLVVEDSADDAFLFLRACRRAGLGARFEFFSDGAQAIDYFRGSPPYADRQQHPLPSAIITDLKMPGVDGFELLRWVRARDEFKMLPVIVLTSSSLDEDRIKSRELGASGSWVKEAEIPKSLLATFATLTGWGEK